MARLSLPRCPHFGGKSSRRVSAPGRGSYSCRRQLGCRSAAPGANTRITGPRPEQPINRTRTNKMTQIQGYFDPRFETVRELFAQQQRDPQARGAALCVTVGDTTVLDIWAGVMDKDNSRVWEQDTLVNVFSCTKPLGAVRSEEHTSELQSRPHLV